MTTAPRQERRAADAVRDQGHQSYLPLLSEHRPTHGGLVRDRTVPLFPGYLFVWLRAGAWHYLRGTRGVSGVVLCAGSGEDASPRPAVLRPGTVERLKAAEVDGVIRLAGPVRQALRPGQPVRVCRGPMAGLAAVFACRTGGQRVRVLLSVLGGVAAEVDELAVEAA